MSRDWTHAGAFVLQLDTSAAADAGRIEGRVEHVASMRSARFESVEDLIQFVRNTLAEEGRSRPESDGTD